MHSIAKLRRKGGLFNEVRGVFYRTIDPAYRSSVIAGSRYPGRYSSIDQPTLYLSSTHAGMEAAIRVHKANRSQEQDVVEIEVDADRIFDLRDDEACAKAGINLSDAISPWQPLVAKGDRPKSWNVREQVIELGGVGLIDPSRQVSGLWHLVLFDWNRENAPIVTVL